MCYDIKTQAEAQLNRARRYGSKEDIEEILEKLRKIAPEEYHHVSGFAHPKLVIYSDKEPVTPQLSIWGLVPFWVKDRAQLLKTWNNTLNARGETIFEKPSFKASARSKRCIIPVSGFYEHHHHDGKIYPYYISRIDGKPMSLAGLYSEWTDRETGEIMNTCVIVTTVGNPMLEKIHNNPKATGPRMPVILPEELEDEWLKPIRDELDEKMIGELIRPFPEEELHAHTVRRLRGKEAVGNQPEASEEFIYEELN